MNWNRLIYCYLPICLRKTGLYALLQVLATPLVSLYGIFQQFRAKMIYQANINPSVIMLRKVIQDECGLLPEIVEGNGMPTDFIVIIPSGLTQSETNRIYAVVNKYKEAGKSFEISNGNNSVTYELIYDFPTIKSTVIDLYIYEWGDWQDGDWHTPQDAYMIAYADGLDESVTISFDVVGELIYLKWAQMGNMPWYRDDAKKKKVQTNTLAIMPSNLGHELYSDSFQTDDEDNEKYESRMPPESYYNVQDLRYYISNIKEGTIRIKSHVNENREYTVVVHNETIPRT